MKRKDIFIMIITFVLLIIIISLSYAYFALNTNLTNNITQNISFDNDAYQIEVSNRNATPITISNYEMMWSGQDELVANTTESFIINITNNLSNALYCTYDIVWEWKTGTGISNYTITSGATKEYTVSWDENAEVQVPNYNASSFILGQNSTGAIAPNGVTTVTVPIDIKFYNLADFDQSTHYNKTYFGYAKIGNISCGIPSSFADYIVNYTPKSGVDAVSNSPWILTSDREGEWRYAGKNPDNYVEFNGELWRIIGVMPNMTYCTGEYGTETECSTLATGDLVKIIRNSILRSGTNWDYKQTSVGSSNTNNGSNDWSDSQLMLMLNGKNYLKTGYDVNGNKLHSSYTITSNVVKGNGYNFYNASYSYLDGNGLNLYIPASATTSGYSQLYTSLPKKISNSALSKIATVRWDLYGSDSYEIDVEDFYNRERNINNTGSVYTGTTPENRPVYWYGKVGLLYPSDYGYATNGDGSTSGSYSRTQCLERTLNTWFFSNMITSCAQNDWLRYGDITSTEPVSGASKWLITPNSSSSHAVFNLNSLGYVSYSSAYITDSIYPVLYLKADTRPSGGNGTWNNPYTIEPKKYWYGTATCTSSNPCTYPNYVGTLQTSGSATGHPVYIGQDDNKYYSCITSQGHEICLSQPYTKYGLTGHTSGTSFTTEQQANAKQAIYQAFIDAGINVSINSCSSSTGSVYCNIFDGTYDFYCGINSSNGSVWCIEENYTFDECYVKSDGKAYCV